MSLSRRWATGLAGTYFFLLGSQYLWAYMPRYFEYVGLSGAAIGLIFLTKAIVRSAALVSLSYLADRHSPTIIVRLLFVIGSLSLVALPFQTGFWAIALCVGVFAGSIGSALPLIDTMVVRQISSGAFGRVRSFGSVGFGLCALGIALAGIALTHEELAVMAPFVLAGLALTAAGFTFCLPSVQATSSRPTLRDTLRLLRRPFLLAFLPVWLLHWAAQAPYNLYLVHLCEERGFGGWVPGAAIVMGVLAEVGFLAFGRRVLQRLGPSRLFAICVFATGFRWWGMSIITNEIAMIAIQVLHGLSFGAFLLAVMAILDTEFVKDVRASGQALLYLLVFGAGSALGESLTGWLTDQFAVSSIFWKVALVQWALLPFALVVGEIWRRRGPGPKPLQA